MKLSENPVFHDKSKHTEIKYHYIRDMVQRGAVKLQYVATDKHIADVLTKPRGSDVSMLCPSDMVRGLVPSMVRCK